MHFIYLCIDTLHSEPIKALDPSSSFLRLEKKDSGGKCDLCPLMLIWTFAWIVTHPMQRVLWNFLPILMLYKVKRPITLLVNLGNLRTKDLRLESTEPNLMS